MKFSRFRAALLLATLALSLVALSACGGDDDDDSNGATTPPITTPTSSGGGNGDDNGEEQEITVSMGDNFFEPKEITVKVNQTIKFEAKNDGTAIHNMVILSEEAEGKNFSSDAIVQPGDESEFEAKFSKTGTYDFQCDYHVPDMVGVITVVD
ncbi:MAG: cupredoxin domain-containing protein [Dehalococcoidia bacterium]|nr:cupredoxin domain-containing protein [Dehalococcoidia bacterium]